MESHRQVLRLLLTKLTRLDSWSWFQSDPTGFPEYAEKIAKPMCMDFMRKVSHPAREGWEAPSTLRPPSPENHGWGLPGLQ